MNKYLAKLTEWHKQGFITPQQLQQILDYESAQPSSPSIIRGFIFLGVCVTAMGMISLIAANWMEIPDILKLLCDFLVLSFIAVEAMRYYSHPQPLRYDALLLGFLLLVMASIGLIAQIYHTYGKFYFAILFWSAMTLPIIFSARHRLNTFIWVGLTLGALMCWVVTPDRGFLTRVPQDIVLLGSLMITTLGCVGLGQFLARWECSRIFAEGFKIWAPYYGLLVVLLVDNGFQAKSILSDFYNSPFGSIYLIIAGLTLFGIYTQEKFSDGQKYLLMLMIVVFSLLPLISLSPINLRFTSALCTIVLFMFAALYYGSRDRIDWFNFFIVLIGLRFFMVYLQVIGSLATTGVGLVISGLVLIALTSFWAKNRNQLQLWVKRRLQ